MYRLMYRGSGRRFAEITPPKKKKKRKKRERNLCRDVHRNESKKRESKRMRIFNHPNEGNLVRDLVFLGRQLMDYNVEIEEEKWQV